MPPAVAAAAWPAAITAVGALGGAGLVAKSASNAAKTSKQSSDAAIAYQREQDAKAEARQKEIDAKAEAQWNAEQARLEPSRQAKAALLAQQVARLGLNLGSLGGAPAASSMPQGWSPLGSSSASGGYTSGKPRTIADLAGIPQDVETINPGVQAPAPPTIGDIMAGWNQRRAM